MQHSISQNCLFLQIWTRIRIFLNVFFKLCLFISQSQFVFFILIYVNDFDVSYWLSILHFYSMLFSQIDWGSIFWSQRFRMLDGILHLTTSVCLNSRASLQTAASIMCSFTLGITWLAFWCSSEWCCLTVTGTTVQSWSWMLAGCVEFSHIPFSISRPLLMSPSPWSCSSISHAMQYSTSAVSWDYLSLYLFQFPSGVPVSPCISWLVS